MRFKALGSSRVWAFGLLGVLVLGPLCSSMVAAPAIAQSQTYRAQDTVMLQARELARTGRWDALASLLPETREHPAGVYAEYWLLQQQVRTDSPASRRAGLAFLERERGNYIETRFRADWVIEALRQGNHALLLSLIDGPMAVDAQANCATLFGRHLRGEMVAAESLAGYVAGASCDRLIDRLVADRQLNWAQLQPVYRQLVEDARLDDALSLAQRHLPRVGEVGLAQALNQPSRWLAARNPARPESAAHEVAMATALARLARTDMEPGWTRKDRFWAEYLPAESLAWVRGQFGRWGSIRLHSDAHTWFVQAGLNAPLSNHGYEHRVRAALRQAQIDWSWVVRSIDAMPESLRQEPAWIYWRARGLRELGQVDQANAQFASIAGQFHYYGQLAGEELGQLTQIPPRAAPPTDQEWAEARNHPGLQRAYALINLGWRFEANREWNFSLRGMTDRQLLAAAHRALELDWLDRAVNTADRTLAEHDFALRFLTPFIEDLEPKAMQAGLDTAWVYGLIRQESRFIMDARSRVGAAGLMQLMPATARYTARRLGITDYQPGRIDDLDMNLRLGTGYLGLVKDDLGGSIVLATAGYNAGPGRPRTWRSSLPREVEGAIFAETIPFNETRDYVQKVLSNKTFYAALLTGEPQSLRERMGTIRPAAAGRTELP